MKSHLNSLPDPDSSSLAVLFLLEQPATSMLLLLLLQEACGDDALQASLLIFLCRYLASVSLQAKKNKKLGSVI